VQSGQLISSHVYHPILTIQHYVDIYESSTYRYFKYLPTLIRSRSILSTLLSTPRVRASARLEPAKSSPTRDSLQPPEDSLTLDDQIVKSKSHDSHDNTINTHHFNGFQAMIINDLVASDFPWDVSSCFFAEIHQIQGRVASASSWGELVAVAALLLAAVHGPSLACFGGTHGAKACHMKAY
jgi:hypothetical protein